MEGVILQLHHDHEDADEDRTPEDPPRPVALPPTPFLAQVPFRRTATRTHTSWWVGPEASVRRLFCIFATAGVGRLGLADGARWSCPVAAPVLTARAQPRTRERRPRGKSPSPPSTPLCRVRVFRPAPQSGQCSENPQVSSSAGRQRQFCEPVPAGRVLLVLTSTLRAATATGWHGQHGRRRPGPRIPVTAALVPEPPSAAAVPSLPTDRHPGRGMAGVHGLPPGAEALKLLLGLESDLTRRLLAYDGFQVRFNPGPGRKRLLSAPSAGK